MNPNTPCSVLDPRAFGASVESPRINLETSLDKTTTAFGSADRHTEVRNTIPISSESSICSSRAAASSSFAIAKDTAKDRSDPIDDRASVAAAPFGIAIPFDGDVAEHKLTKNEVQNASLDCFTVSRNGQIGPLRLRRFVFSSSGPCEVSKKRDRCYEGLRVRKRFRKNSVSTRRKANQERGEPALMKSRHGRSAICFATTFGATLKTVLDFAGISIERKRLVAEVLDDMAEFFTPVSESIAQVSGTDRGHLVNGLATRTVGRRQSKFLSECQVDKKLRNTWLFKSGQANVTLGATAAILVAHYVLAVTGSQPKEVIDNLTRSINLTRNLLDLWNTSAFKDPLYADALGAEIRALERAKASAIAAEEVASAQKLDRLTALHLQLRYMRAAAWPANAICESGQSHLNNLDSLRLGESIKQNDGGGVGGVGGDGGIPEPEQQHQPTCILNKDLPKIGYRNQSDDFECASDVTSSASSSSYSSSSSSSCTVFESDGEEDSEEEEDEEDDGESVNEDNTRSKSTVDRTTESLAALFNL